jgi:hypothetical protein
MKLTAGDALARTFAGLGLFRGLTKACNCIFGWYMVKGICSQDIFRIVE